MAGGGEGVGEETQFAALGQHGVVELLVDHHRRDRLIGAGEPLGEREPVGPDVEGLRTEPIARPARAGDDLVGEEQHLVLVEDRLHLLEIGLGRHDAAAAAHHGLGEEGRDGLRPLRHDQLFQVGGEPRGVVLLALARLAVAVEVRAVGLEEEVVDRQVEVRVHLRDAGDAGGAAGHAVEAHEAGDDLLLLRLADGVVVVPGELDQRVVRLGARVGEEDPRHRHMRGRLEPLGEPAHRLGRLVDQRVVVGQHPELLDRRIDQRALAEAEVGAPHAGDAFDVVAALLVDDGDTLAAGDDERRRPLQCVEIAVAVGDVGHIARAEGVRVADGRGAVFAGAQGGAACIVHHGPSPSLGAVGRSLPPGRVHTSRPAPCSYP